MIDVIINEVGLTMEEYDKYMQVRDRLGYLKEIKDRADEVLDNKESDKNNKND